MMNGESMKDALKAKLSDGQKALLRLLLNTAKNPQNIWRHLNEFRYKKECLHTPEIGFTPPVFAASITETCNLRCPTCLYILKDADRPSSSFISVDKFAQVLDKYNRQEKAKVVFLTGGEPLLHPQFDELVDICEAHGVKARTTTNGMLARRSISSLSRLLSVNVSVDAYDYESFGKYRGGTRRQFDMIVDSLRILRQNGIWFSMSFLLSTENLSEVDRMIGFAEEAMPNNVSFHNINPHGSELYRPLTLQDRNTRRFLDRMLDRSDYPFDIYLPAIFDTGSPSFLETKCIQPWYYLVFNSMGDVSYCCMLSHSPDIGNVLAGYDLNSPKMVAFRKRMIAGKIMGSCLYCQRRFLGKQFGEFSSSKGKWSVRYRPPEGVLEPEEATIGQEDVPLSIDP